MFYIIKCDSHHMYSIIFTVWGGLDLGAAPLGQLPSYSLFFPSGTTFFSHWVWVPMSYLDVEIYQPPNYKYEGRQYSICISLIMYHFRNTDLCYDYFCICPVSPINLQVCKREIHFIHSYVSFILPATESCTGQMLNTYHVNVQLLRPRGFSGKTLLAPLGPEHLICAQSSDL